MKAKQLVEILNLYPEADVKMVYGYDISNVVIRIGEDGTTVELEKKE